MAAATTRMELTLFTTGSVVNCEIKLYRVYLAHEPLGITSVAVRGHDDGCHFTSNAWVVGRS
jgi:hypothetical protein